MDPEEMAKHVDTCYKNILEKFNPGARQLINAGKSYLKSLHGAAAAAKIYLESLSRVAKQAQQGTCGGTADIGIALQQMIDVQREIQNQQLNTLKAFYVDLLVPLETNLEKDTKVVMNDQKKFNQQFRLQYDIYNKAANQAKKHSKKSANKTNRSCASYDKEIKHLQAMEEEKSKLDAFCEGSLKQAIVQERKRYGFVLERQISLTKHWLAHYGKGAALLEKYLDGWQETAKARDSLPDCVEFLLSNSDQTPELSLEDGMSEISMASQLRKSHSVDASILEDDIASLHEAMNPKLIHNSLLTKSGTNLSKARSEFNLAAASMAQSTLRSEKLNTARPKSMVATNNRQPKGTVRALYAYLSSGEHQLSFLEGDVIILQGERSKGWHYGENCRTGKRGWFPMAYTESTSDNDEDSGFGVRVENENFHVVSSTAASHLDSESSTSGNSTGSNPSDAGVESSTKKSKFVSRPISVASENILSKMPGLSKLRKSRSAFAERLLCPVPVPSVLFTNALSSTPTSPSTAQLVANSPLKKPPPPPPRLSFIPPPQTERPTTVSSYSMKSADISIRSSSDSGFVNETPVCHPLQPEIDYSDEDTERSPKFYSELSCKSVDNLNKEFQYQDENFLATTMTLDRPKLQKKTRGTNKEPPVLGYLATLTRVKNSKSLVTADQRSRGSADHTDRTMSPRSSGRLFVRNKPAMHQKGMTKLAAGKIKAAIFRSRSKDSLTLGIPENYSNLWEYKPIVPVYVGWRPPMPLPTEKLAETTIKSKPLVGPSPSPKARQTVSPRPIPAMRRKFSSEPDLLEAKSDCSYQDSLSELPMLPSLPPTLPFLSPVLARTQKRGTPRLERSPGHRTCSKKNFEIFPALHFQQIAKEENNPGKQHITNGTSQLPHTLPRPKGNVDTVCQSASSGSLHVKFSMDDNDHSKSELAFTELLKLPASKTSGNLKAKGGSTFNDELSVFVDYGYRIQKRLLLPEGGSNFDQISETTGNLCGPWYDLWGNDTSVKLCDIAQL